MVNVKVTEVILHSFTCTPDLKTKSWKYSEDVNPNLNDGKRHKVRGLIIAQDNNPYPNITRLKEILTQPIVNHSNIKNSKDYGTKLINFCPTCLAMTKSECKKKFGGNW